MSPYGAWASCVGMSSLVHTLCLSEASSIPRRLSVTGLGTLADKCSGSDRQSLYQECLMSWRETMSKDFQHIYAESVSGLDSGLQGFCFCLRRSSADTFDCARAPVENMERLHCGSLMHGGMVRQVMDSALLALKPGLGRRTQPQTYRSRGLSSSPGSRT